MDAERFPLLVRAVVERTELGAFVQELDVEYDEGDADDGAETYRDVGEEGEGSEDEEDSDGDVDDNAEQDNAGHNEAKTLAPTIIRAAKLFDASLAKALRNTPSGQAALLVLLLWHLPKLHTLQLTIAYPSKWFFDTCYFAVPPNNPVPSKLPLGLRSVEEVRMFWWDTEGGLILEDILPVLFLPSLRRVEACMIDSSEGWDPASLSLLNKLQGQGRLPELALEAAAIDHEVFGPLFRLFNPETFKSFTYSLADATVGFADFNGAALVEGLAPVHRTLERLKLTLWAGTELDTDGDAGTIPTLRGFTGLQELSIDASLLGILNEDRELVDLLPPNLRTLHIESGLAWSDEELPNLQLIKVVNGLKHLKTLGLRQQPGHDVPGWLTTCCKAAGVALAQIGE